MTCPTEVWSSNRNLPHIGCPYLGRPLSNTLRQVWTTTLKNHILIHFCTQACAAGFCLFKRDPPRVWGLPALSKRHPTKTWRLVVATIGAERLNKPLSNPLRHVCATTPKNHILIHFFTTLPGAGILSFKQGPPRGLRPLSETLRGFWGWPMATPQGGGG